MDARTSHSGEDAAAGGADSGADGDDFRLPLMEGADRFWRAAAVAVPPPCADGAASACARWFGVWGLGFGVRGLGLGVRGLGLGVWGLGFGVWGLGFGGWGVGFWVQGLESRVRGSGSRI